MKEFTIVDGVAQIHNPELDKTWLDRPDYIDSTFRKMAEPFPPQKT